MHESVLQKATKAGVQIAGLSKPATCRDVSTTMIYTHVLNRGGRGVRSPLDR